MNGQQNVLIGSANVGTIPISAFGLVPATAISDTHPATPLKMMDVEGVAFPTYAPHLLSKTTTKRRAEPHSTPDNRIFKRAYGGPHPLMGGGIAMCLSSDQTPEGVLNGEAQPPQVYRGVSRHRLTQRWEASLWLEGRQLYLGGFDSQMDAAHAYDLAALACKGPDAIINFSAAEYEAQLREIADFSREEVVAYVRRRSAAFSRGKSKYRGVSGHNGRWEARIGSFGGRKNVSFLRILIGNESWF